MKQQPLARNNPSIALPLLRRALPLHQAGKLDQAERLYLAILAAQADHFDALHLLGVVQYQQGRIAEAYDSLGAALRLRPGNAAALNTFGLVQAMLRRPEQALASYDRALALKPDYAEAFDNRGNALRDLKRPEEALASYERALALRPENAVTLNNRGGAFIDLKRFEEALASCDKALAVIPAYAEALVNRGVALAGLNRPAEALASYDRAIAVNPRLADAYDGKGLTLLELGRSSEASQAIERAIELAPRRPRFYYHLGESRRFSPDEPQVAAMEALAREMPACTDDERIELSFALGKALADLGQHERSFQLLLDGNARRRRQLVYNEAGALGLLERTRAAFTVARIRESAGAGGRSPAPRFVIGMPRSGTTLIEQILASHARVFGAGESNAFDDAIAALGDGGRALYFPEIASLLSGAQLSRLGADYVRRIVAEAPAGAERIVNKMLKNFRHLGLIHLALPNARIIHARRDPVDTCLSCFSKMFVDNLPYTYDLAELGRYYRAYEAVMAHWRDALPQGVMLEVRYEEVVADLEGQARRILTHCGLEWDSRCLAFHGTERPVRTASASQVRQPIYGSSVGRRRAYEPFIAPLLEGLGPSLGSPVADDVSSKERRASA